MKGNQMIFEWVWNWNGKADSAARAQSWSTRWASQTEKTPTSFGKMCVARRSRYARQPTAASTSPIYHHAKLHILCFSAHILYIRSDALRGCPDFNSKCKFDEIVRRFLLKHFSAPPGEGIKKHIFVLPSCASAEAKFEEMLEDPYLFCRRNVRRNLARFFNILKDSHHPLIRMSPCALLGDENHQGSSSSAARQCFWRGTFLRNRAPAYGFVGSVMRILMAYFDLQAIVGPANPPVHKQPLDDFRNRAITLKQGAF